jgi:hypothetical protein
VDFSKLKLELYDFLGLVLPGLIAICEGWTLVRGWHACVVGITQIGGTGLTLVLVFAFAIGNIIQELGDVTLKAIKGQRYFRGARDRFWVSSDGEIVRNSVNKELGYQITSVDTAFDYCLTKLKDRFAKRDIFLATSDLCRSFVVLSALALMPSARVAFYDLHPFAKSCIAVAVFTAVLVAVAWLMWRRMVRFRHLSETTVFRVYLATVSESQNPLPERRS